MRRRVLALALAAALLCASCGLRKSSAEEGTDLYYLAAGSIEGGGILESEKRSLTGEDPVAAEVMEALLAGPESQELTSPFPAGTVLRSCREEEGLVTVDLSEAYGGLSGVELSLADACVVLTLCGLERIDRVYLTVEGEPRPFRDQVLSPADLLLENRGADPEEREVALWFYNGSNLAMENRKLTLRMGDDPAIAALQAALAGPETAGLEPLCPAESQVLGLRREGDTLILRVSRPWPEEEVWRTYALERTLAGLEEGLKLVLQAEEE